MDFKLIIVISGFFVLIGIAISAYQSQTTVENLSDEQKTLTPGSQITIIKDLDPGKNQRGVYSLQITDFKNETKLIVTVLDPTGSTIASKSIMKSAIQENFKIVVAGQYKLQIENKGNTAIQVLGIFGYYPPGIELLDISGFIVLIGGLSGLAIGITLLVRNRVKVGS